MITLKINGYSSPTQAGQAAPGRNEGKTAAAPSSAAASPAAVTHLSSSTGDTSRDVDTARVAEIRQAIAEGRLEFRADLIADKLIASVQDLLDQDQQ
ncbi:flagellar biosynthesis anti-sigma factor FlgM [Kineobactrum salinum]|uniref:Negative regulator of flagellin synthesis n=1 Tax=Kineobactrum salinum TaxID=2708301 RepID=A0A6C0TXT5_9GAMM|nr:flagellar biosynthesis anti-sigma factor FlgM [Kineobactrum salinum]QIB64343.1 flagellar biosynthesis anti-sigma factor FlgM [Kineobactrum salinum]